MPAIGGEVTDIATLILSGRSYYAGPIEWDIELADPMSELSNRNSTTNMSPRVLSSATECISIIMIIGPFLSPRRLEIFPAEVATVLSTDLKLGILRNLNLPPTTELLANVLTNPAGGEE